MSFCRLLPSREDLTTKLAGGDKSGKEQNRSEAHSMLFTEVANLRGESLVLELNLFH